MKDKLVNRLSFGAIATVSLYVTGFLWKYAYLASITDHIGWIKVVKVDYLYLGVMALLFTIPPWVWAASVVIFVFFYSNLFFFMVEKLWLTLSYEKREKIWLFFNDLSFSKINFNVSFASFIFFVYVIVFMSILPLKIVDNAKASLAYRLSSGPIDTLCEWDGICHKGKLLYANDNQFYFYTYDGSADYRNGHLLVVGINNADVKLDWDMKAKKQIDHIVEANISDWLVPFSLGRL